MSSYPLPDASKVQDILGLLFDGLNVTAGGKFDETATGGSQFGVFISDTGEPVALCGADVALAAGFGAALSMLPPNALKQAITEKNISGVLYENLSETMNICTRLVLDVDSPHLKLEKVYPLKSLPAAAATLLKTPRARREFQLQMPKYGGGVLTLVSS